MNKIKKEAKQLERETHKKFLKEEKLKDKQAKKERPKTKTKSPVIY